MPLYLIRKAKEAGFTESSARPQEPRPPFLSWVGFCENQKSHMKGFCLAVLTVLRKLSLLIRKGVYCQIPLGLEWGAGSRVLGCGIGRRGGWRALEGLFQPVLSRSVPHTQVTWSSPHSVCSLGPPCPPGPSLPLHTDKFFLPHPPGFGK